MKPKIVHKIVSVLIAAIVVFSTLSFSVEKHFCGSHLVDTAIFTKVKKCCSEIVSKVPATKKCCKDEVDIVKGQDQLNLNTFDNLNFAALGVFIVHFYAYNTLFESLPKQIIPHKDYAPPNLIYDIQILDAVYLI